MQIHVNFSHQSFRKDKKCDSETELKLWLKTRNQMEINCRDKYKERMSKQPADKGTWSKYLIKAFDAINPSSRAAGTTLGAHTGSTYTWGKSQDQVKSVKTKTNITDNLDFVLQIKK